MQAVTFWLMHDKQTWHRLLPKVVPSDLRVQDEKTKRQKVLFPIKARRIKIPVQGCSQIAIKIIFMNLFHVRIAMTTTNSQG